MPAGWECGRLTGRHSSTFPPQVTSRFYGFRPRGKIEIRGDSEIIRPHQLAVSSPQDFHRPDPLHRVFPRAIFTVENFKLMLDGEFRCQVFPLRTHDRGRASTSSKCGARELALAFVGRGSPRPLLRPNAARRTPSTIEAGSNPSACKDLRRASPLALPPDSAPCLRLPAEGGSIATTQFNAIEIDSQNHFELVLTYSKS